MKFLTLVALFIAPFAFAASAEHCVDLDNTSPVDPSIAASKNKGNLYVKLNHATDLTNKDWIGQSNPFIEMWLETAYKHRSKDTKGLNPTFNETFCFYVRPGQDKLYVRVVDKGTFYNDKIGVATIPLTNLFQTGSEGPTDYDLPKWFGLRSNGAINMQMLYQEDTSK